MARRRHQTRHGRRRNPRGMLGGLLSSDLVTLGIIGVAGYWAYNRWGAGLSCFMNPNQTKCVKTTALSRMV